MLPNSNYDITSFIAKAMSIYKELDREKTDKQVTPINLKSIESLREDNKK